MTDQKKSEKLLINYYKTAKKSLTAKMKSEDHKKTKLKFKIASFIIYELTHSAPDWFRRHFLFYTAKINHRSNVNQEILEAENTFYDVVANYLTKLESEEAYVKEVMAKVKTEKDKEEFWRSIVSDAFIIVGIHFTQIQGDTRHHETPEMQKHGRIVSPEAPAGNSGQICKH